MCLVSLKMFALINEQFCEIVGKYVVKTKFNKFV